MSVQEGMLCLTANLVAFSAAVTDKREHKIYNKLTLPSILLGLLLNLLFFGLSGLGNSLSGFAVGIGFSVFWLLGMLKAGDIKLYMALGALCGWRFCVAAMIASVIVGGAAAVVLLFVRKTWRVTFRRLKLYLLNLYYSRSFQTYQPEEESAYFSFGCCIFAGALISTWYCYFS